MPSLTARRPRSSGHRRLHAPALLVTAVAGRAGRGSRIRAALAGRRLAGAVALALVLSGAVRSSAAPWPERAPIERAAQVAETEPSASRGPPAQALSELDDAGPIAPGARRRALWLSVSGGMALSPGERERVFALLELGVGLDQWLGARAPDPPLLDTDLDDEDAAAPAARSRPALRAPAPAGLAAAFAAPEPSLAAPTPTHPSAAHAPRASAPPPASSAACSAALTPLARATVAEALRVQGAPRELRRLDGMAARSRAAAGLPEVRLGAGTSRDESLRINPTLNDPTRFSRDGGRDLWLEARLTWRLDAAIFAHDEIAIMRLRAQQREDAAQLARDVLEGLLDWQRARLVLESPLSAPEERDAAALRHFGAVARLDVLTDGWFSRQLERWGGADPLATGARACGSAGGGLQGPHGFRDSAGTGGPQEAR